MSSHLFLPFVFFVYGMYTFFLLIQFLFTYQKKEKSGAIPFEFAKEESQQRRGR